jgi:nicotinate-nucleotide adenylyltransferase
MKIALYSGSFNPIHNGHLAVAEAALDEGYDEVWLVISPQNPHKKEEELWPFEERMKMVELAVVNRPGIKVSDCENRLPRPSYTIKTLEYLKETYPQHQFRLLIGGDNLQKFQSWKDYARIIDSFGLIVYPRSFSSVNPFENHANVDRLKAPLLEISSSEIREKLSTNQSIHGLVPAKVEEYLIQNLNKYRSESAL